MCRIALGENWITERQSGLEIWQLAYENKILLHCIYLWTFFFWPSTVPFKHSDHYLFIFVLPQTVGIVVDT